MRTMMIIKRTTATNKKTTAKSAARAKYTLHRS